MAFQGSTTKLSGAGMPIKGRVPPVDGAGVNPPAMQDFRQVPKIRMTKGSPPHPDQLGNDSFTTDQPSQGINVLTGQGPI